MKEQIVFECGESLKNDKIERIITLEEFDSHIERYLKIIKMPECTAQIFYDQFRMCFHINSIKGWRLYRHYRMNSRYFHNKQLDFLKEI